MPGLTASRHRRKASATTLPASRIKPISLGDLSSGACEKTVRSMKYPCGRGAGAAKHLGRQRRSLFPHYSRKVNANLQPLVVESRLGAAMPPQGRTPGFGLSLNDAKMRPGKKKNARRPPPGVFSWGRVGAAGERTKPPNLRGLS